MSSSVWCPSSQAIWWLSRSSLYLSLIADISETNVSNPFTLASTAAPAPLSPAPKITILFIYSNVLLFSDRQALLSSFSSLLFRSSAAHIFLKLIIGLILSTILMLQISCIGQSVFSAPSPSGRGWLKSRLYLHSPPSGRRSTRRGRW